MYADHPTVNMVSCVTKVVAYDNEPVLGVTGLGNEAVTEDVHYCVLMSVYISCPVVASESKQYIHSLSVHNPTFNAIYILPLGSEEVP